MDISLPNGEVIMRWVLGFVSAAMIAAGTALILHESRLNVIDNIMVKNSDANEMERRIMDNLPHKWFEDKVTSLEGEILLLRRTITQLEARHPPP